MRHDCTICRYAYDANDRAVWLREQSQKAMTVPKLQKRRARLGEIKGLLKRYARACMDARGCVYCSYVGDFAIVHSCESFSSIGATAIISKRMK